VHKWARAIINVNGARFSPFLAWLAELRALFAVREERYGMVTTCPRAPPVHARFFYFSRGVVRTYAPLNLPAAVN
jgi:hypothetical protein